MKSISRFKMPDDLQMQEVTQQKILYVEWQTAIKFCVAQSEILQQALNVESKSQQLETCYVTYWQLAGHVGILKHHAGVVYVMSIQSSSEWVDSEATVVGSNHCSYKMTTTLIIRLSQTHQPIRKYHHE